MRCRRSRRRRTGLTRRRRTPNVPWASGETCEVLLVLVAERRDVDAVGLRRQRPVRHRRWLCGAAGCDCGVDRPAAAMDSGHVHGPFMVVVGRRPTPYRDSAAAFAAPVGADRVTQTPAATNRWAAFASNVRETTAAARSAAACRCVGWAKRPPDLIAQPSGPLKVGSIDSSSSPSGRGRGRTTSRTPQVRPHGDPSTIRWQARGGPLPSVEVHARACVTIHVSGVGVVDAFVDVVADEGSDRRSVSVPASSRRSRRRSPTSRPLRGTCDASRTRSR